ncbi:hypothetical protein ACSV5G_20660 [Agrobacterium cavarae]|uniref:hypothetical protein n=1 Tax=Agrobacterium cavarae TaxID=2528239 RepID=UPI003FD62074
MRDIPFTRPTVVAANEFLGFALKTHTQINKIVLRLGLEDEVTAGSTLGIEKKVDLLGRLVLARADEVIETSEGKATLVEAFVRQVIEHADERSQEWRQDALLRGLARDGYVVVWTDGRQPNSLRSALPGEIDLPAANDEVHLLLKHFKFTTSLGHLDQAVEAHTRGDWAAANGQIRTFLEGLLEEIAFYIEPSKAKTMGSSENRRAMLASTDIGFLGVKRNEWSPDGKSFIHGLFKMLHSDGSHPGLSTEDHCTFRLHIGLVTARMLLRRLREGKV